MIYDCLTDMIGNTPLLKVSEKVHGFKNIDLYIKMEMLNPFGSIKDRTAFALLEKDLDEISAKGQTIFENSSGNTAKAMQAIAATYDVKVKLLTAPIKADLQKQILLYMGVNIEEIAGVDDCFDPNNQSDPQYLIQKISNEHPGEVYFPSQFSNIKNIEVHYQTTGREIVDDLGKVDFFFCGMGTLGSSSGIIKRLREHNPECISIGVCAESGQAIPGIRPRDVMIGSPLFNGQNYQNIIALKESEAIDGMMTLNRKVGLLCGPSTGANYYAALTYLKDRDTQLTERKTAVLIACDRAEWYMDYVRERMPEIFGEKPKALSFMAFDMDKEESAPQIKIDDLTAWLEEKDPFIIDVRSASAFRFHKLGNSINIPQDIFDRLLNQADPFPKDRSILLICSVGERTLKHAAYLKKKGYDAYSLEGGIQSLVDKPELLAV